MNHQELTEPGWWCERCETALPEIADSTEADAADLKCPHCKKRHVAWMTPEKLAARLAAMQVHCPTPDVKEAQAADAVTPQAVAASRQSAAHWFQRMREAAQ